MQYACRTPIFVQLSVGKLLPKSRTTLVFSYKFEIASIRCRGFPRRSRIFQRKTLLTLSNTSSKSIKVKQVSLLYSILLSISSFKLKMASCMIVHDEITLVPLIKGIQLSLSDGYLLFLYIIYMQCQVNLCLCYYWNLNDRLFLK